MKLTAGARLGPYEIVAPLGAGGMGEVYRAKDTRLGRDVAIKILSPDTASSAEARQRFEREARTISQLSHPHICALYDVGDGYLVMELLEGETLAQRLASGALPLDPTLRYATQIADALDKAHRAGIVHRDLKPANVMVTKGGVKLLDFGLAKPGATVGHSAIQTLAPISAHGAIAGTVQYMAPEQLAGRPADARSDIYALGAVIYEMATGRAAFGASMAPVAPAALDRLVRACLAADPDERWQSAHDVRMQLAAIADDKETAAPAAAGAWPHWAPWAIAGAAAVAAVAALSFRAPSPASAPRQTVRLAVPPPRDGDFFPHLEAVGLSVSPDGTRIAYAGHAGADPRRIWIRTLTDLEAHPIAGTEGASASFWSPGGNSLAFFAGDKLRRIDLRSGAPVTVCDVPAGVGLAGTCSARI